MSRAGLSPKSHTMQPSKPQPFRLPQRFDSPTLAKYAIPGEPTVIVRAVGVGSTAPFEYSDRNGRQAIFRYEREYDAHVLKVPASVWNHNKGFMAHELMDQRRLPHPLVVTVEVPAAGAANVEAIKPWIEALGLLSTLAPGMVINVDDPVGMAKTIIETVSKSQDGQEAKSSGPYPESASASLAPATTSAPSVADALGIEPMKADESPEMDAPGNSKEASDVVVGQVSEQPGASATFSTDGSGTDMPTGNAPAPLYSRAWDMLESPMRLKELAAALETEPETLKASIQEPLSAVELGHAGWVKRREPQA